MTPEGGEEQEDILYYLFPEGGRCRVKLSYIHLKQSYLVWVSVFAVFWSVCYM